MDAPHKAPFMRELVNGPTRFIEKHNNQQKLVYIPKCSNEASAVLQIIKHKFLQKIVNMLGAGAEYVIDGFYKGAQGFCWGDGRIIQSKFGPHIQKLLDECAKVVEEMETEFVAVYVLTIVKNPGANCASIREISMEMFLFSKVLHCHDICFISILRQTRTFFNVEEIGALQGAINKLQIMWPKQRMWEQEVASVTPKSHNLWFEVVPQISYPGRFFYFMENLAEKLHTLDRLTGAVYCHIQDYEFCKDCKQKQEATTRNIAFCQQLDQEQQNCKHKFTPETITN
jgi:hypothetical protein